MAVISQPTLIPVPWASQGQYAEIPQQGSEAGRASWNVGFPPECALPLSAGGIPPHWLDFQGVLYVLSHHAAFAQAGSRYAWDASLDYPAGACIIASNGKIYQAMQESGPNTSAGAKNPSASGNEAYWSEAAVPDGVTITVSGGKASVALAQIGSDLADGTTITANAQTGKLTAQLPTAADLADGNTITANAQGKLQVANVPDPMPVGAVIATARKAVPTGYLACDGQAVSRSTYAALFDAIGTTYGAGNGTTTFNVPNLNNRFVEGAASTGEVGTALNAGLPNITGRIHTRDSDNENLSSSDSVETSGALSIGDFKNRKSYGTGTETGFNTINFNAHNSNSIYGNSNTVQPPALKLLYIIKH